MAIFVPLLDLAAAVCVARRLSLSLKILRSFNNNNSNTAPPGRLLFTPCPFLSCMDKVLNINNNTPWFRAAIG